MLIGSFPNHPIFAQWAHEQSGHGVRDEGYTQTQQHNLPLTEADLSEAPTFQQAETNSVP